MQKLLPTLVLFATFVAVFTARKPSASAAGAAEHVKDDVEPKTSPPVRPPSVLTGVEFETFANSIRFVENENCAQDLNRTLWGILSGHRWAIAMYDATAKSAVGIESGMIHQFGHYDECLSSNSFISAFTEHNLDNSNESPVRAQYCLANVTVNGMSTHNTASRRKEPTNETIVYWGACVPASCSASEVAIFLENFLRRPVTVDEKFCEKHVAELNVTRSMLNYVLFICFFLLLTAMSTSYHAYLLYMRSGTNSKPPAFSLRNETLNMALISFSIIENTKKLFQTSKDQLGLNSINGIKALAMLLILAGHALSFIYGGAAYNAGFVHEQIKLPTFSFLSNSLLFVDTFLLLSGFLFCRILLIELERRRGHINVLVLYAARYIRLTPAYMAVIGFYMTWFPQAGDGPIWRQRIEREQERCIASWWLNILYVNNYINTDKLCMFQSWYLSVDSQLFFVAPLIIYSLYKFRKYGLRILVALVILTAVTPFFVTYLRKLDPTLMVYADEINDLGSNAFYIGSYIKTHMRASAYVVGLLTGFLVHVMQEKSITLPPTPVRLIWMCAFVVGVASMYSICRFYAFPFSNLESTLYAGGHKLGWNLSVAWLVLAVTTGHAGRLSTILSARLFAPISRLTYCAYLCNGLVELYHSSRIRTASVFGYANLINDVLSHIVDTFIIAFVVCLLFESPIHALERILLRKADRNKQQTRNKAEDTPSQSPSTSEEQVA